MCNDSPTSMLIQPGPIASAAIGVATGISTGVVLIICVVYFGFGSRLYTGSDWINSMVASMPGPMALVAITLLYSVYGTIAGAIIGLGVYSFRCACRSVFGSPPPRR